MKELIYVSKCGSVCEDYPGEWKEWFESADEEEKEGCSTFDEYCEKNEFSCHWVTELVEECE